MDQATLSASCRTIRLLDVGNDSCERVEPGGQLARQATCSAALPVMKSTRAGTTLELTVTEKLEFGGSKSPQQGVPMRQAILMCGIFAFAAEPAAAQPTDVQFLSNTVSTDLHLGESKESIHGLRLQCRLADGGKGTLTLNPTIPTFNDFGDPIAGGRASPKVTLDCTLRLAKDDKGRRLFEIRGPKIKTRLSLVVERDIAPWGDGRLLVHNEDGDVRYVVDLWQPHARPQPSPKP
jgi:hypothetical protein